VSVSLEGDEADERTDPGEASGPPAEPGEGGPG
jgi:hypothetical protein